jgi:ketosteroid isomerase-like protein
MSQENVEVVRGFEESMVPSIQDQSSSGDGDFASILALLDEECAFRPPASLPHGGDWIGHEAFIKMGEKFGEAWNFIETPTFTFRDAGDIVLLHATFVLESRVTGKQVPIDMVELIKVKDGKIVELVPYYRDTVPQSEAAGMATTISRV